jgi:hypothetical protein
VLLGISAGGGIAAAVDAEMLVFHAVPHGVPVGRVVVRRETARTPCGCSPPDGVLLVV